MVVYQAPDGSVALDVRLEKETIWLSLNQLAALLGRDKSLISCHLRNIFKEGELAREATVAKYATVQTEGDREVRCNCLYTVETIEGRVRAGGLGQEPAPYDPVQRHHGGR
jgi:hypothetical protein